VDGVTTALELESGVAPVAEFYAARAGRARVNFGGSAAHFHVRPRPRQRYAGRERREAVGGSIPGRGATNATRQRVVRATSCGTFRRISAVGAAGALLVGAAGGCHAYRAVPAAALAPPAAVRVRYDVPREVVVRSGAEAGARPRASEFTGRVVGRRGDSLEVRVGAWDRAAGRPAALAPGTIVAVPLDTAAIRARRFSPGRTAAAVLGATAAAAVALFVTSGEFCR
jgi:hypothetical protein